MPRLKKIVPLGLAECCDCGATVQMKLNKSRAAYFYCNGTHDDKGARCGAHRVYGEHKSIVILKEFNYNDEPEQPAGEPGETGPARSDIDKSDGAGLGDAEPGPDDTGHPEQPEQRGSSFADWLRN